jgi:histidinol-phosphatase
MMEYKEELEFAKHLLDLAKGKIMPYFQTGVKVEFKEDQSPVTIADKKAEEIIREELEKQTPDYGIIGEEFGTKPGESKFQWVIDPIDGTKSFIHGVPLFGTLLALLEDGKPVVGLIGMPALNSVMWAAHDSGCYIDGERCHVSDVKDLSQATLLDGSATTMEKMGLGEPWKKLRDGSLVSRGWGDCYGYYLVATGRAEVMVDPIAEIWDLAPMSVIIPEAGGKFSSLKGGDFIKDRSGVAANGALHGLVVDEFAGSFG